MKHVWLPAAAALALCGWAGMTNVATAQPGAAGTAAAPGAPTSAGDYARQAALGDMYEIQSSKLAETRATSPEVKKFARQMVTDHTGTTNALKAALASANVPATPPTSLDPRRADMLRQLQGASGPAFDQMYVQQQMTAHEEALALHSSYAKGGDTPPLRTLASQTAQKVQSHIDMLRRMQAA
jgi:putative membrane protein